VAHRNGAAPGTDHAVTGGRGKDALEPHSSSSRSQSTSQTRYSITEGRTSIGSVEVIAGAYIAIDTNGAIIGRYGTLRLAVRALPCGGAS
jgi:hypothetical protein